MRNSYSSYQHCRHSVQAAVTFTQTGQWPPIAHPSPIQYLLPNPENGSYHTDRNMPMAFCGRWGPAGPVRPPFNLSSPVSLLLTLPHGFYCDSSYPVMSLFCLKAFAYTIPYVCSAPFPSMHSNSSFLCFFAYLLTHSFILGSLLY